MITEDYVSFEIAKLLKEKGFDCLCHSYFRKDNPNNLVKETCSANWNDTPFFTSRPTLQMTMKWLREVHNLFIQICIIPHTTITIEQKYYLFTIHKNRRTLAFRKDFPSEYYSTYEEACETGIKYCLENLI